MFTAQSREAALLSEDVSIRFELVRRVFDDHIGDWLIRSITFADGYISHTLRFEKEKPLIDAICVPISNFIADYLPTRTTADAISSRKAEYVDRSLLLRGVHSTSFEVFNYLQKCIIKINQSFGDLPSIFKTSNIFSHLGFIADYLPAKIAQDVVVPLFRLSKIAEESFVHREDEVLAERTIANIRIERDNIARYLEYYDRYLSGDKVPLETLHDGTIENSATVQDKGEQTGQVSHSLSRFDRES